MLNIARGQVLGGAGTVLQVFLTDPSLGDSLLRDPTSLAFVVYSTANGGRTRIFPAASGEQAVDLEAHRLGVGRFFAAFTVPGDAPLGAAEVEWSYEMASGETGTALSRVDILAAASAIPPGYCSLSDLREEGVSVRDASDARTLRAIHIASREIEQITDRWFEPRCCTFTLDGDGDRALPLPAPIIAIESVVVAGDGLFTSAVPVDLGAYRIYARHLTDRMVACDDRNNPKLEIFDSAALAGLGLGLGCWPEGRKNVRVKGVFGYTDWDGSPAGQTPELIRDICMDMAINRIERKADRPNVTGPIKAQSTRDQSVQYSEAGLVGAFTGDPDVDMLLESFRRPPTFRAV